MRRTILLTLLLVGAFPASAGAASLHLVFPQVVEATVVQGQSTTVLMEVQAYGATRCSAVTAPVRIDSLYSVDATGGINSGVPSDMPITTDRKRGSSDNCYIHNPVLVPLTVTAAAETPVGDYGGLVRYGKGGDGGVDLDGPPLEVHVVAPDAAPQPVSLPESPLPTPEMIVLGDRQAAPRPTLGKTLLLTRVKGKVSFQMPGRASTVLGAPMVVPNGTAVDATDGVVKVTVVRDKSGKLDSADAWGGGFKASQNSGAKPTTTFTLVGGAPTPKIAAQSAKVVKKRSLWVNGKGNFKTRGKRASAIVRGTYWLTEETASGTRVSVKRGLVAVRDFVKKRTVLVAAGQSYTAKLRTAIARRVPAFTGRAGRR